MRAACLPSARPKKFVRKHRAVDALSTAWKTRSSRSSKRRDSTRTARTKPHERTRRASLLAPPQSADAKGNAAVATRQKQSDGGIVSAADADPDLRLWIVVRCEERTGGSRDRRHIARCTGSSG